MSNNTTTVLYKEWCAPSNAVLKLKISDNETRRIRASSLFKRPSKAYQRLVDLCIEFHQGEDFDINANRDDFFVKTTYLDEENDTITFSSEEEFIEAWRLAQEYCGSDKRVILPVKASVQRKKPSPEVVSPGEIDKVSVELEKLEARIGILEEFQKIHAIKIKHKRFCAPKYAKVPDSVELKNLDEFDTVGKTLERNTIENFNKQHGVHRSAESKNLEEVLADEKMSKCRLDKAFVRKCVKSHPTRMKVDREIARKPCGRPYPAFHLGIRCDGCSMNPIRGPRYRATNRCDYDLCQKCFSGAKDSDIAFEKMEKPARPYVNKYMGALPHSPTRKPGKLAKDFVHGRHTCDGCMKSPIIGLRYHALNLKDYDLCSVCYSKYEGDDIVFEAVELDRDQNHQTFWKKRAFQGVNHVPNINKNLVTLTKEDDLLGISIQATEDLFFEGKENTVRRVEAGNHYPCTLNKNAKFSSIFHSYTKGHGLSFDDLEFYSTKSLSVDDTPVKVNLQKGDVIFVRKRQKVSSKTGKAPEKIEDAHPREEQIGNGKNIPDEGGNPLQTEGNEAFMDESIPIESQVTVLNVKPVDTTQVEELDEEFVANEETTALTAEKNTTSEQEEKSSLAEDAVIANDISQVTEALIEQNDEKSSGTSEEWDLVDDENIELGSDEALARAAQMVGSALFEEVNKSDESMLAASDQQSIPLALMTRWQHEVSKLHEIGFYDDKKSIDVLEELEAANIGVDSNEPVEFEKVVDKLLNSSKGVDLF